MCTVPANMYYIFSSEYDACLDGPCTSPKTTCNNAPANGESQYPYTCTCNTDKGFVAVGNRSGLENQELCVPQVAQSSSNVTCSCGPNTNCMYVEDSKACDCLQGFLGDASSTSGCAELTPSAVFILQGTMQIPLLFQTLLLQQYNYSIEHSQTVNQVQALIDGVLSYVTGYIPYSANVTTFKPCAFINF